MNHTFFKTQDWFGHPITLNYDRQKEHKTKAGGLCTVLIKLFVFVYVTVKLLDLVLEKQTKYTNFQS